MNISGRSLELYFIDGNPEGMLTAEVFNWTGHVLKVPRTQITQALLRPEAYYTGVYLLLGEDDVGEPLAYIGESEDISERIRNHDSKKDWWSSAVLVTSAANNLNKAHVKYLEARLVEEAHAIGKIRLDNTHKPARPSLSEAAQMNMEVFLGYLLMVLPAIRIDMFVRNTRLKSSVTGNVSAPSTSQVFEMHSEKHDLNATAVLENGELVVQKGSTARLAWVGAHSGGSSYGQLHADLVRMGVIIPQGNTGVFNENYAFKSPSAAAAVVMGRPTNGTTKWKVKGQSLTYKEWEAAQLVQ